jgi:multiple sugar transport system substrate-binding protein
MVDVLFSMAWGDQRPWRGVVHEFNRLRQGEIRVTFRNFVGLNTDDYRDELQEMFEGRGRRIDVMGADVTWPAEFADNGWIADLSGRFPQAERQQFLPATIQANTYQGRVWGVPWFAAVGVLFYRKDLLDQRGFGPPQTWDELKQMALQVNEQDAGIQHGYVFQGAQYEGGVCNGLEYIWTHGGDVLDPQNPAQVIIDSPQTVAGLTTERSMTVTPPGVSPVSPQEVDGYTCFDSWEEFFRGKSVFCRHWPAFYSEIGGQGSPLSRQKVGVAPIPAETVGGQRVGCIGGWNLCINAASDAAQQDAAWQFIQFMTNANNQKARAIDKALLPTRQALYQDPQLLNQVPILDLSREALTNGRPRPAHPHYSEMSAAMAEQFNRCLKGQVTPAQAAQTLQATLSNIV